MNWTDFARLVTAIATALNAACVVMVWAARRSFAQRSELMAMRERLATVERGPDWEVLNEIRQELGNVKVSMASISGAMPAYIKTIDLMHAWLVEHAK